MLDVIRSAASADPVADKHALATHLDVAGATDILWALNHPNLYMLLAGERGWPPERYEQWLGDLLCSQLLTHPARRTG